MKARYLVRFDDVCPTMAWSRWEKIEATLDACGLRPIVAVVPDNRDPSLIVEREHPDFWGRVRAWQEKGWAIGLHGYQHLYLTPEAGIMRLKRGSEFAGLPAEEQRRRIRSGLEILAREGVKADVWVAPGHSFDAVTVRELLRAGVTVISDGFFLEPVRRMGVVWVPQQLWGFREMPVGLWTICVHPNTMGSGEVEAFCEELRRYRRCIVALDEVLRGPVRRYGWRDRGFEAAWHLLLASRRWRRMLWRRMRGRGGRGAA